MNTSIEQPNSSIHTEKEPNYVRRRIGVGAVALGIVISPFVVGEVVQRLQPETIAEFNVMGGTDAGGIAELQDELHDAIADTEIDFGSIAGVTDAGQRLEEGPNTVRLERNGFGRTWVEVELDGSTPKDEGPTEDEGKFDYPKTTLTNRPGM